MPTPTHYQTLNVAPHAPLSVIRAAYKALVQVAHPDRNPHRAAWAQEQMVRLNEAFAVLSDPGRRSYYDATLTQAPGWVALEGPGTVAPEAPAVSPEVLPIQAVWPFAVGAQAYAEVAQWQDSQASVRKLTQCCWVNNPTTEHAHAQIYGARGQVVVDAFIPAGDKVKMPLVGQAHELRVHLGAQWTTSGWVAPKKVSLGFRVDLSAVSPTWIPMESVGGKEEDGLRPEVAAWALDAGDVWALPALLSFGVAAGVWHAHHNPLASFGWALLGMALGARALHQWHRSGSLSGAWPLICGGVVAGLGAWVPSWSPALAVTQNPLAWASLMAGGAWVTSCLGWWVQRRR